MGDHDPSAVPDGLLIEAVDWLPSGGRSGLVRVRGRWDGNPAHPEEIALPDLHVERGDGSERHTSLPDPRAGRERGAWRGAYVVHAEDVESADTRLVLEFAGGVRIALPRPSPSSNAPGAGAEVVDRAVLADRRARRAEAAEQAQARIAREALKAVEVLELRAAELEDRLDAAQAERDAPAPLAAVPEPRPGGDRQAERLRSALGSAIATVADLRLQLHEARVRGQTAGIAQSADSVRLAVVAAERGAMAAEILSLRERARSADGLAEQHARALEEARAQLTERSSELTVARRTAEELETELVLARAEVRRLADVELPAAVDAAVAEREAAAADALAAQAATSEAALAELTAASEAALAEQFRASAEALASQAADSAAALTEQESRLRAEKGDAARAAAEREAELRAAVAELTEAVKAAQAAAVAHEDRLADAETALSVAEAQAENASARARAADVARASLAGQLAHHGIGEAPEVLVELEQALDELTVVRGQMQVLSARVAAADSLAADLERAREELATEREAASALRAELTAAAAQSADDGAVVAALTAEIDIRTDAEQRAVAELASLRSELEAARTAAAELAAELEAARAPAPPPVPAALPERAAEQESVAAAAAPEPAPARERIVADLAAAAEALRSRVPEPEPEPAALEPAPFTEPEPAPRPVVVSAGEAPRSVATGRDARAYPALRGALVKLAHDDPAAAGRLLAGLLPAQWKVLSEPVDYDLTIAEVGSFACTVSAGGAKVRPLAGARGRQEAEFHLRTDALTLAEMLAGVGPRPRRFGRAKVSGRRRRAKALHSIPQTALSLPEAVRAGATLEPELVLRTLAYAVHPSWTRDHDFTIAHTFTGPDGDETLYLTAAGGRGLRVSTDPPAETPRATVVMTRTAFEAMLRGDAPPPGERPATRGDHRAAQTLRAWADRARSGG